MVCVRESSNFEVEEIIKFGPNIVAFQLQTGSKRFYIVDAYVPPSNRTTIDQIRDAQGEARQSSSAIYTSI